MKFTHSIFVLAIAILGLGLFSGCQKDQFEEVIIPTQSTQLTGLQEVTLDDLSIMGIELNDVISESDMNSTFELPSNEVGFRNHRPIIDPCSEGARIFRMDIENFTEGADVSTQSSRFRKVHPNVDNDGVVMPEYNNQFVFWETLVAGLGAPKVDAHTLLDLGRRTSGRYVLGFNLKVLPEHTAYFDVHRVVTSNIEDNEIAAKFWFYNENVGIIRAGFRYYTFEYQQNSWMDIHLDFDVDNNEMRFYINNDLIGELPISYCPGGVGQTIQIEAVTYSTEHHQRNTGVGVAAPNYVGGFKTDNHCFARVN